jgi:DNA polymerase
LILSLDFETYSDVDIKKVGAYHYAMHPSTEALMLGWALGDTPVRVWDITSGGGMPSNLMFDLQRPKFKISAFNATFERLILKHVLGIDIPAERFRCTQVRGFGLSFTGGLDDMLRQTGLQAKKDPRGKALINRFSKPQPASRKVSRWTAENDPEGYAEFMEYCKKDVEVERQLGKFFEPYGMLDSEQQLYCLDQKINDVGVPVDRKLIKTALTINEIERAKLLDEMRELTGLQNPNSGPQLLGWLKENGLTLPNMQKETIEEALREL